MIRYIAKHKTVIGVILMIIGVVWLIPALAVRTTVYHIKGYTLIDDSDETYNTFRVEYAYPRGETERTADYKEILYKDVFPTVGEEGVCHYWLFPPYPVFRGDARSPVPPLICFGIGFVLVCFRFPWFRLKKKKRETE